MIISTLSPDEWDKEEQDPAQLHGHQAKNRMTEQSERSADTPSNGGSYSFDFFYHSTAIALTFTKLDDQQGLWRTKYSIIKLIVRLEHFQPLLKIMNIRKCDILVKDQQHK